MAADPPRRRRRTSLLTIALSLALLVAVIVAAAVVVLARPAHAPGSATQEGDCASFLHVGAEDYALLTGTRVRTLRPGARLGTGTFDACRDTQFSPASDEPFYAVPGVPERETVLVLGPHRRGVLFVNLERPAEAWSPRLVALFRARHAEPTTR